MSTVTTTETLELQAEADVDPSSTYSGNRTHAVLSQAGGGPESGVNSIALRKGTTVIVSASIAGVTGISALQNGLVTVVLPKMAKDLNLSDSVLLWYGHSSVVGDKAC
jgi:hypothetical protein